jgi:hypothetical protein
MYDELGEVLRGNENGLINVLPRNLPGGTEENHEKPHSGKLVSQSILEPRTPKSNPVALPLHRPDWYSAFIVAGVFNDICTKCNCQGFEKTKFINACCLTFIISYFNKQIVQGFSYQLVNAIHNLF